MKKIYILTVFTFLLFAFGNTSYAQVNESEGFTFIKSIDQVDLYFTHTVCDNGEFLLIKAINTGSDPVSLNLQPIWSIDEKTFESSSSVTINLDGNSEIKGDCDKADLKVSIHEFFTLYLPEKISFDLIKK